MTAGGRHTSICWFSAAPDGATECHDCGLQQRLPALEFGDVICRRCGRRLRRIVRNSMLESFALAVAGLTLMTLATVMPFITLDFNGRLHHADLVTGIWDLALQGYHELAVFVLITTVVAPFGSMLLVALIPLLTRLRQPPRALIPMLIWVERLSPWAMIEVYLLALFVAYTKIVDLATVSFGPAFYALAAMMLVTVMLKARIDHAAFWAVLEQRGVTQRPPPSDTGRSYSCHGCGLLLRLWSRARHGLACPRCGSQVHKRKPQSLARTWALLITAIVLYVPANLYPVMTVVSLGRSYPSTILGGVEELLLGGMWPLALIVFFASITVPFLKIFALMFLLITAQRGSTWRLRDRTRLYRLVETIGRWSMIDIFVVSILIALVQVGQLATILPGFGATCFAAVVVLTMLAAMSFEPRMMWDRAGRNAPRQRVAGDAQQADLGEVAS
ncbi:MAG: PqiA/YebS family transporter subunit [Rhodospirillales bacterium]